MTDSTGPAGEEFLLETWAPLFPGISTYVTILDGKPESLKAFHEQWAQHMLAVAGAQSFDYEPQVLRDPNSKWVAMSMMQKGIRRGQSGMAMAAAYGLFNGGMKGTVWRRLSVIALEDLGYVGLPILGFLTAMVDKKVLLPLQQELFLALSMIEHMAACPKDRTAADSFLAFEGALAEAIDVQTQVIGKPLEDLAALLADRQEDYFSRICAYRYLRSAPKKEAQPLIDSAMEVMGVPAPIEAAAYRYKQNFEDGMWWAIPVMWQELSQEPVSVKQHGVPKAFEIAGVPSCCLDQFTIPGKKALAYFSKACTPVRKFLDTYPDASKQCVADAVFAVEGGALNQSLDYDGRSDLARTILVHDFAQSGFDEDQALELCEIVAANLEDLHYARNKVASSPLMVGYAKP